MDFASGFSLHGRMAFYNSAVLDPPHSSSRRESRQGEKMLRAPPRFMRVMKLSLVLTLSCSFVSISSGQNLLLKINATGGVPCEQFGHGLAISGTRIVAGAAAAPDDPPMPCASGPGAAYVFDWNGDQWLQTVRLEPTDGGS